MNKRELALLEKAFTAEIEWALERNHKFCLPIMQTKSKLAEKLVGNGLLDVTEIEFAGVKLKGYEITEYGRMVYCSNCRDIEIPND